MWVIATGGRLDEADAGDETGPQVAVRDEEAGRVRTKEADTGFAHSGFDLTGEFDAGTAGFVG